MTALRQEVLRCGGHLVDEALISKTGVARALLVLGASEG
jgi:hypothetical protein